MFEEMQEMESELPNEILDITPTKALGLFQTTKEQRNSFCENVLSKIDDGEIDPLKVHVQIKSMEEIINSLTSLNEKTNKNIDFAKRYRAALLDAAKNHGKKFEIFGAKFEEKETGSNFDYSLCNDPELVLLYAQSEEIDKKIKAKETMLKTLPIEGIPIVNEETGETYLIYPPAKSSTTSIAVSLK